MTEKEKMIAGELYNAADPELLELYASAKDLCHELAHIKPSDTKAKAEILRKLLPHFGENAVIVPPFFCDYGWNIHAGNNFYANTGCVILDVAPVHIGNNVMLAPNVQIYTAAHPVDPVERAGGLEFGKPIRIGNDVWIGGNTVLCPGVDIGDRAVIGAGSVVAKSIPPGVLAAGNPCRIIRSI